MIINNIDEVDAFLPSFFGKQQDNLNNNVNIVENERHMGVDAQIGENESSWEESDYDHDNGIDKNDRLLYLPEVMKCIINFENKTDLINKSINLTHNSENEKDNNRYYESEIENESWKVKRQNDK